MVKHDFRSNSANIDLMTLNGGTVASGGVALSVIDTSSFEKFIISLVTFSVTGANVKLLKITQSDRLDMTDEIDVPVSKMVDRDGITGQQVVDNFKGIVGEIGKTVTLGVIDTKRYIKIWVSGDGGPATVVGTLFGSHEDYLKPQVLPTEMEV